jgi:lipopolysaccharide exporter
MRTPTVAETPEHLVESSRSDESLSRRAATGGFWVVASRGLSRAFAVARLVILARILAPADFGLMGTALLVISTLEAFSQTGFESALVQNKRDIEEYLDTAWTVLVLRGIALFLVLYLIAPYVAVFFDEPVSELILKVSGVSVLLQAFSNIGITCFYRELEFGKQFAYESSGMLVDFLVATMGAITLQSVWALVFGLLAGNLARCIASYAMHPYRPRLGLDSVKAKELFGYGKWVLGSKILIYMGVHIPKIFVGRLLGVAALGFYEMAYQISNVPATEITYALGRVAFPVYSKVQDQRIRLRQTYFRVAGLTVSLAVPAAVGIMFLAPDFTRIFLGEKWLPMVPTMQLLAGAGLIKSIVSTGSPLFAGTGHPRFEFYMELVRGMIVSIGIYPLTANMDIPGTALSVLLSAVGMLFIWYPFSRQVTGASWARYAHALGPPVFSSLFMAGTIYISRLFWDPIQQALILAVPTFVGISLMSVLVYAAVMYLTPPRHREPSIVSDLRLIHRSLLAK